LRFGDAKRSCGEPIDLKKVPGSNMVNEVLIMLGIGDIRNSDRIHIDLKIAAHQLVILEL